MSSCLQFITEIVIYFRNPTCPGHVGFLKYIVSCDVNNSILVVKMSSSEEDVVHDNVTTKRKKGVKRVVVEVIKKAHTI